MAFPLSPIRFVRSYFRVQITSLLRQYLHEA